MQSLVDAVLMRMEALKFLLLLCLWCGRTSASQSTEKFTAVREYHLGFPRNLQYVTAVPSLLLLTSETKPVTCIISVPSRGLKYRGTITAGDEALVLIPYYVQGRSGDFDIERKAVHIQVDSNEVVIIGQNYINSTRPNTESDGAFLAIPTLDLNVTQYKYFELNMVLGRPRFSSQIMIVGTQPDTTMNITATQNVRSVINGAYVNLAAGKEYSYKIGQFQTVYISHPEDLTGTKILTDKPVSLLSGQTCVVLPSTDNNCDHMIEQSLPTKMWGTVFYVAPIPNIGSYYFIRVLAANDATKVDIYCNSTKESYTINEGKYIHKQIGRRDHCAIYSNKEVLVAEYAKSAGNGGHPSDPAMALVPALIHYSNKILSSTVAYPRFLLYTHSLTVMVLAEYFDPTMIYLSSGGSNKSLDTYQWIAIQANGVTEAYYTIIANIPPASFQVIHTDPNALLNTMSFGFSSRYPGFYGHAGKLEVRSAPLSKILTQPTDASAAAPFSGVFTCSVRGFGYQNVTWHRQSSTLPHKHKTTETTSHRIIISTLTIPNVTEKDAGAYYCSVWANNRIVRSKTAHLSYSGPPVKPTVTVLPGQLMELTDNNSTLTMICSLYNNTFNFTWEKEHKRLTLRAQGVNSQQLTITKLDPKDSGEYRCIASNSTGTIASDYSSITIKVALPIIVKQPRSTVVQIYGVATFECIAKSYGSVSIFWRRQNSELPITADVKNIKSSRGVRSILRIEKSIGYYKGYYYCIIKNVAGMTSSKFAYFNMTVPCPQMIIPPMPITVQSNTTVTFSCLAWSFGGLIYKWTRTGNSTLDLPHSSSVFFNNKQLPADAKYSTTVYELQILNVQVTDGGLYCCEASNECGNIKRCARLVVNTFRKCPALSDPKNGKVFVVSGGKIAFFLCNSGFTIIGNSYLHCINGIWSPSPPKCQ